MGSAMLMRTAAVCASIVGGAAGLCAGQCPLQWSPVAPVEGPTAVVLTVVPVFDSALGRQVLYVGGVFTSIGGVAANNVARWDGTSWSALGVGTSGPIDCIAVVDDDGPGPNPPSIIVGGDFTTAGGVAAARVARWTGTAWAPMGDGFNNQVNTLAVFDADGDGPGSPVLYAGGYFSTSGTATVRRLASWNGAAWSEVSGGASNVVHTLQVVDNPAAPGTRQMYVAGGFSTIAGIAAPRIAVTNGTTWTSVGAPPQMGEVVTLAFYDEDGAGPGSASLFVGGAASATSGNAIMRLSGGQWTQVGVGLRERPGFLQQVWGLATHDDGSGPALYATGPFTFAGDVPVNGAARWNGSEWTAMAGGLQGGTLGQGLGYSMCQFDEDGDGPRAPALIVGGNFDRAGGIGAGPLARWSRIPAADADGNGAVEPTDVAFFVGRWFTSLQTGTLAGDFDGDGAVTPADVSLFVGRWFEAVTTGC